MPGIELGDLGSKIGMTSKDNGFMRFKNVKIPRFNMFSRICQVERDGTFTVNGDPRLVYQVMMFVRQSLIHFAPHRLS